MTPEASDYYLDDGEAHQSSLRRSEGEAEFAKVKGYALS